MRRRARLTVGRSALMVGAAMCRSLPQSRGIPDPLVLKSLRDEKNLWLGFWLSPRSGQELAEGAPVRSEAPLGVAGRPLGLVGRHPAILLLMRPHGQSGIIAAP